MLLEYKIQDAAIESDNFQIAVMMNWFEYKKHTNITEYEQ